MQQARRHPAREGLPEAGQHRQSQEEGVGRRGMRVVRGGVEEEVGQAVAGQVILDPGDARGEDQPLRVDPARRRLPLQVLLCGSVQFHEPQDAPRGLFEDAHPDGEDGSVDLVGMVEGTKDEPRRRQAALTAGRCLLGHL